MSSYERYKKDVIDPRQANRGNMKSSREIRRELGRKNMKPKSLQLSEVSNIIRGNKALIQSLKKQLILNDQKINALQHEMDELRETLATFEKPTEPTEEDKLREKYGLEMHKNALRGGKETKIYQKWREKQTKAYQDK